MNRDPAEGMNRGREDAESLEHVPRNSRITLIAHLVHAVFARNAVSAMRSCGLMLLCCLSLLGAADRSQTPITQWLTAGPLPARAEMPLLIDEPLGSWSAIAPRAETPWTAGALAGSWAKATGAPLNVAGGTHLAVAYVYAPTARTVLVVADGTAGMRVLLAGKTSVLEAAPAHRETEEALAAGWSTIAVLAQGPFTLRLATPDGFDDPALRFALAPEGPLADAGGDSAAGLRDWLAKGDPRTRFEPRAGFVGEVIGVSPLPVIANMQQYGDALGVVRYRVVEVESGDVKAGDEVLVVHWTVLAKRFTAQSRFKAGDRHRLVVDDFDQDHPDLANLDFKNEWDADVDRTRWFTLEWSAQPAP